jgi:hypothetical protein
VLITPDVAVRLVFKLLDELTKAVFRLEETLISVALIAPEAELAALFKLLETLIRAVFKFADELTKFEF